MSIELVKDTLNLKELGFEQTIIVKTIKSFKELTQNTINPNHGILIDTDKEEEARKIVDKLYGKVRLIIVQGRDISFNRKILENKKVNILVNPEKHGKKDTLYERDSGLNHILCKIAKENNTAIAIDLKEIIGKEGKEKARYLARVMQNIRLCKKYKVSLLLTLLPEKKEEARTAHDLKALARVLGMDTKMALEAVEKNIL